MLIVRPPVGAGKMELEGYYDVGSEVSALKRLKPGLEVGWVFPRENGGSYAQLLSAFEETRGNFDFYFLCVGFVQSLFANNLLCMIQAHCLWAHLCIFGDKICAPRKLAALLPWCIIQGARTITWHFCHTLTRSSWNGTRPVVICCS